MATEITTSAAELFVRNPTVDTCYVTSDEAAFISENLALLHAQTLVDDAVDTYQRADDPDAIALAGATIKRDSGLLKAKAALPHAAAQSEVAALETYMDELAEALGADDLEGIGDPVVLSGDISLARSRAVIGAWKTSGLTVVEWTAMTVEDRETAVLFHINSLP